MNAKYYKLSGALAVAFLCVVLARCGRETMPAPTAKTGLSLPQIYGRIPEEVRRYSRAVKQTKAAAEKGTYTEDLAVELVIPAMLKAQLALSLEQAAVDEAKLRDLQFFTGRERPERIGSFLMKYKNGACEGTVSGNIEDVKEFKTNPGYACVRVVLMNWESQF